MRGIGGLASICAGFASITFAFISSIRFNLRSSTVAKSCSVYDEAGLTTKLALNNEPNEIGREVTRDHEDDVVDDQQHDVLPATGIAPAIFLS
jgi:hypothetical protein